MKKGQIVTCIYADIHPLILRYYKYIPVKGGRYTVRDIRPFNAEGGLLLEEIRNTPIFLPHYSGYIEPAFSQDRFRIAGEESFEIDRVEEDIKRRNLIQSN